MSNKTIWKVLGIERTRDQGEIRKAYARQLKKFKKEVATEDFQTLRECYEAAMRYAEDTNATQSETAPPPQTGPDRTQDIELTKGESVLDSTEPPEDQQELVVPQDVIDEFSGYVNSLQDILTRGDQDAAIKFFDQALNSPTLHNLTYRPILEGWLIQVSDNQPTFPFEFFDHLANLFRWNDDLRHLDYRLADSINRAMGKYGAYTKARELRKKAKSNNLPAAKAARMLTGSYRPILFFWRRLQKLTVLEVRDLFAELDHYYPAIYDGILDPKVVLWWRHALRYKPISWRHITLGWVVGLMAIGMLAGHKEVDSGIQAFVQAHYFKLVLAFGLISAGSIAGYNYIRYRYGAFRENIITGIQQKWTVRGAVLGIGLGLIAVTASGWTPAVIGATGIFMLSAAWVFHLDRFFWTQMFTLVVFVVIAKGRIDITQVSALSMYLGLYLVLQVVIIMIQGYFKKPEQLRKTW